MNTTLRHFPRLNMYKNSTGSNQYRHDTKAAYSYQWWLYFREYKGYNIFNNSTYSSTTSRHQSDMLLLLNDLVVPIDLMLSHTTLSLSNPEEALKEELKGLYKEINRLTGELNNKRCKRALDAQRYSDLSICTKNIELIYKILEG